MSKLTSILRDQRGASLTEYAMLLAVILLVAAGAWTVVGQGVRTKVLCAAGFGDCTAKTAAAGEGQGENAAPQTAQQMSAAAAGKPVVVRRSRGEVLASQTRATVREATGIDFTFKKFARLMAVLMGALGLGVGFVVFRRARADAGGADGGPAGATPLVSSAGSGGGGLSRWTD